MKTNDTKNAIENALVKFLLLIGLLAFIGFAISKLMEVSGQF
jgi:hypothetical protein